MALVRSGGKFRKRPPYHWDSPAVDKEKGLAEMICFFFFFFPKKKKKIKPKTKRSLINWFLRGFPPQDFWVASRGWCDEKKKRERGGQQIE